MSRLITALLVCLFLAAPSADMWCRASCTPVAAPATAVPSCHDAHSDTDEDRLVPTVSCLRDLLLVARLADLRRDLVTPSMPTATPVAASSFDGRVGARRLHAWPVRARVTQAFPPCIVLRV